MTELKEIVAKFIDFANSQTKGKGVKNLKEFDKNFIKHYSTLEVNFSVGKGRATNIPWISFLGPGQKTQDGIYPVILFYRDYDIVILAYGVSEKNIPELSWNLDSIETIREYFGRIGLAEPEKYGGSFISKVYKASNIRDFNIDRDIIEIIDKYNMLFRFESVELISKIQLLNELEFAVGFSRLNFRLENLIRITSSLLTKPFVILTGLSGSGKTKLAQSFAMWISESKEQYAIVPVGADWTNREPLLGYPNSLVANHYVKPDSGVLDILLRAHENYIASKKVLSNSKPYFLILDEMNLSHVERYFADFLSTMESGDAIKLYSGDRRFSDFDTQNNPIEASLIPREILLPKNLFIIGTVNIDETTYMFSPKVLDRANTIEFRISEAEMQSYFINHSKLDMNQLLEDVAANRGKGAGSAVEFMKLAAREGISINKKNHQETFINFFKELQKAGAEFGYRTANEMSELIAYLLHFDVEINDAYDIAIMQKLLPKLNGSRSKLNKIIPYLLALCEKEGKILYPLSHEKLSRMKKNADENGFASYAEA